MNGSVKIIHSETAGSTYRFLADFYRLVGIFVGSCTLKQEHVESGYTQVVIITDGIEEEKLEQLGEKYPGSLKKKALPAESLMAEKTEAQAFVLKTYLHELVADYIEKYKQIAQDISDIETEALRDIADIYVDCDLMRYRSIYTYFFEFEDVTNLAHERFADAYIKLWEKMKDREDSRYYIYTQLNLARCVNETCNFLKVERIFDTDKCLNKADYLLELAPQFYNVYILKAFLAELDMMYIYECENFYRMGVDSVGDYSYMSYPRYRMGRYYERFNENPSESAANYEKALELNDYEYRAIYKMIQIRKAEERYGEAIELCKRVCNILHTKDVTNYLQPRECEYLYKAYAEMELIYGRDLKKNDEASRARREKQRICGRLNAGANPLYREIFGEMANDLSKKTAQRLQSRVEYCIR